MSDNQVIPEAAVEAAARVLQASGAQGWLPWEDITPFGQEQCRIAARTILEAAAPHLAAAVLKEAANAWREYLPAVAGYGKVQPVPVWLERRAEWTAKKATNGND